MSKAIPAIRKYMTASPHTIGADQSLDRAHAMMREYRIRHLPVLRGGRLAGVISERDLALLESLPDLDASQLSVEEAMSTEVYAVSPDVRLDEVAAEMAAHKYGCAVVVIENKVVGIFTLVDVCRALGEILHRADRELTA
jgi:acetoin utilization protein AcuB